LGTILAHIGLFDHACEMKEAQILLGEAVQLLPEEQLIVGLQGVLYALTGGRREGPRLRNDGLCEPKILRTCASLSNGMHFGIARATRSCLRLAGAKCQQWICVLAFFF